VKKDGLSAISVGMNTLMVKIHFLLTVCNMNTDFLQQIQNIWGNPHNVSKQANIINQTFFYKNLTTKTTTSISVYRSFVSVTVKACHLIYLIATFIDVCVGDTDYVKRRTLWSVWCS